MMDDFDVSFIANQMVSENPRTTYEDVQKRCKCSKAQMRRLKRNGLLPRQITEQLHRHPPRKRHSTKQDGNRR